MINKEQKNIIIKFNDISNYCLQVVDCKKCVFLDNKTNNCFCGSEFCPAKVKFCEECGKIIKMKSSKRLCEDCYSKDIIKQDILKIFNSIDSTVSEDPHISFIDKVTNYIYNNYTRKNSDEE